MTISRRFEYLSDVTQSPNYKHIPWDLKNHLIKLTYRNESFKKYRSTIGIEKGRHYEQWVNEVAEFFDMIEVVK